MPSSAVIPDSQFAQEMSQGAHMTLNTEFMALLNESPPVTPFTPFSRPQLQASTSPTPFFSNPSSYEQQSCLGNPFCSEPRQHTPLQNCEAVHHPRASPANAVAPTEGTIAGKKQAVGKKMSN